MDLGSLIAQYGYFAVLLGALIEGETVLLLAGYAAHRGYLNLGAVVAVGWVSATVGDQFYFWLGRRHGHALVRRFPGLRARIDRASRLIEQHPVKIIFAMRFLFGLRIALPIAAGMSAVSWRLYAVLNIASAALWTTLIGLAGYAFGALLSRFIGRVERYEHWVILGAVVTALIVHLMKRHRTRAS